MKTVLATKSKIIGVCKKLARKEQGAALVEYGLLVGLIAVVCIAAITLLGTNINALFQKIAGILGGL
jgi:pilus assembly protein Flp/PilA